METSPDVALSADKGWNRAQRIGFRLGFSYLVLYLCLCRLIGDLQLEQDGIAPGARFVTAAYSKIWAPIVVWTGKHILNVSRPLAYAEDGNSDGIYGHVQLLCIVVLAATAALIWTLMDRRSTEYRRLHEWLRIALRYALAFSMLSYGTIKVFLVQFPAPRLMDLLTPQGHFSPFWLLWTFMGYSAPYTIFAGSAEVLAAVLLLFCRTTTLGALVAAAVLINVGMLDFSYGVPEKLDVIFLLLSALVLLSPDFGRLTNVLLLSRPTSPARVSRPLAGEWIRTARVGAKAALIIYMIATTVMITLNIRASYSPNSPFYGIYEVEEFTRNGQPLPPLTTDTVRWRKVVFASTDETCVELMDDSWTSYRTATDAAGKTVALFTKDDETATKDILVCSQPDSDHLVLEGSFKNDALTVHLKRFDESKFELLSSKFRWINGFP